MTARLYIVAGLLAVLWLIELLNASLGHRLNVFGILPRSLHGLAGIPLAPLLHGSFQHLLVNSVPLAVLGLFVLARGVGRFVYVTAVSVILGGGLVWLAARPALHVGASGLIFGYFGYLLADAWYTPSPRAILIAALTVVLYGGMIVGVMPGDVMVSWESHLAGFVAGIVAARTARPART